MSDPDLWNAVDEYVVDVLGLEDSVLRNTLDRSREAGLPDIQVSAAQGALLGILARAVGARLVLEIGTLGGYSTICLARGLMPGGRVLTLEVDPTHAEVARTNLAAAGLEDRAQVLEGPALETLARLRTELQEPVDLVFIDADKLAYADYLAAVRPICRPGSLILADNLVRKGAVVDASSEDPSVLGARRYNEAVARDPGLRATVIQTVGSKGHDGLGIAVVTESTSDR
jgi:predicted O-methyltransferase YrrM